MMTSLHVIYGLGPLIKILATSMVGGHVQPGVPRALNSN